MTRHTVIIGAGIVGVSTGIWLRRAGVDVTIVERAGPAEGTSHGNAGVLAALAMVPVTAPGLVQKSPGMLLSRNFPLFMRWMYLPKLAPWLLKYMAVANDSDTRRIAKGLTPIVSDSVEQHKSLAQDLGLGHWITDSDYVFAYNNRAAFESEAYTWELRRDAGFTPHLISGQDVHDYEPNLGRDIQFLAIAKDHGFIKDPGGYVKDLAKAFVEMGGTIRQAEVQDFVMSGGKVSQVATDQGPIDCDDVVIATGAWSKPLMKKLGLNVPLEAERGYHIVFENAQNGPSRPTMVASGKFVATPMTQGTRCAGVVEFGGLKAGPSRAPLSFLRRHAAKAFPNMTATGEIEWLGHRPAPSDSLPLIGEIAGTRIFTAFGHQHIGLTGGPKTGRLVAGMITDQASNIDMRVYDPQRFKKQ